MIHDHRVFKYHKITFSLPGNVMDCVKKGIVGYVLEEMDKGQVFLRRRPVPFQLYHCTIFIVSHIPPTLRNLYTDSVTG
jgi:hypothetical protein